MTRFWYIQYYDIARALRPVALPYSSTRRPNTHIVIRFCPRLGRSVSRWPSSAIDMTDRSMRFTTRVPDKSSPCRVVRGRRYRPAIPNGMRCQLLRRHLAVLHHVLAEMNPPPKPTLTTNCWTCWTNKTVVVGAAYLTFVIHSVRARFCGSFRRLRGRSPRCCSPSIMPARAHAVCAGKPPITRLEIVRYFMGGRRRVPCPKTRRRKRQDISQKVLQRARGAPFRPARTLARPPRMGCCCMYNIFV